MSRKSKTSRTRIVPFTLAVLVGVVVGLAMLLGYAYSTAELWLTGRVAGYTGLALVPLVTAASAAASAIAVGKMSSRGQLTSSAPVLVAGLLVFAIASVIRVYPLPDLTFQLPTYLDANPGIDRALEDLKRAELPMLTASLGQTFALAYMIVEALVLFATLVLISRMAITAPFCYSCRNYCERHHDVMRVANAPIVDVLEHINIRNWAYFRGLGPPSTSGEEWIAFDTASCQTCGRTNTLSIRVVDRSGKRVTGLVHDLKVTQDDLRTVERLFLPR